MGAPPISNPMSTSPAKEATGGYNKGVNKYGENSADTISAMGTSHDKDEYMLYDNTIKWKMSTDIKWVTG